MTTLVLSSLLLALSTSPTTHETATTPPSAQDPGHLVANGARGEPGRRPFVARTGLPSESPTVVFDRPTADGALWAVGHTWKASFDDRGFTFIPFFGSDAPRNFPLRLQLSRATVGGTPLPLSDGEPAVTGGIVSTARGTLTEVVRTGLCEVEQSFVFATLPNRGALTVELVLTSELACGTDGDGLVLRNDFGSVTYRHALAKDAAGNSLSLPIVCDGDTVRLEIPAAFVAAARLPLVLDPVLGVNPALAPGYTLLQREPDVATIQSPTRSCVVWRRQWSASDIDCWAALLDANLAPIGGLIQVDYTTNSWSAPAIASNNFAQTFVVVSQVDSGSLSWIGGRRIDGAGVTGPQTFVEGVGAGLPGNNYRPDIGGDPFFSGFSYYTVVWEHETSPGNHDIYFRQLYADGSNTTGGPFVVTTSPANQTNPAISKSNGDSNWFVVFQTTTATVPISEAISGTQITWYGGVVYPPLNIAYPIGGVDHWFPRASSPIQIEGVNYGLVAFQRHVVATNDNDIVCHVLDGAGTTVASMNLSQVEAGGLAQSWNQILPDAESDGVRFAVSYSERWQGLYDYDTRVTTIAYSPSPVVGGPFRLEEERVPLGASGNDEYWTRMSADSSGGPAPSPRYVIVDSGIANNDVQAFAYGGYASGPFFTVHPNQCGSLSITAAGTPVLGNPVTFTVGSGAFSGTILGFPGTIPLNVLGCNCVQGVANGLYLGNPLVWTVPPNPNYVGIALAVQGWTIAGSQCLGIVDLSDTIEFTIR